MTNAGWENLRITTKPPILGRLWSLKLYVLLLVYLQLFEEWIRMHLLRTFTNVHRLFEIPQAMQQILSFIGSPIPNLACFSGPFVVATFCGDLRSTSSLPETFTSFRQPTFETVLTNEPIEASENFHKRVSHIMDRNNLDLHGSPWTDTLTYKQIYRHPKLIYGSVYIGFDGNPYVT